MKKHIDLRPSGVSFIIKMDFKLLDIIFTKYLLYIAQMIITYKKVSKRLGLIPQIKITIILVNLTVRIITQVHEPSGLNRRKLKTFLKFFNPPQLTDLLYSGQSVNNNSF
jgi:hypothetical protein